MTKSPLPQEWRDYYAGISDLARGANQGDVWAVLRHPRDETVEIETSLEIGHQEMLAYQQAGPGELRDIQIAAMARKIAEQILDQELLEITEYDVANRAVRRLIARLRIIRPMEKP